MGWQTAEFGTCHEGIVGAALADGSEPAPVCLDMGSGALIPDDRVDDLDTSAAYDDWAQHIDAVERQTVPLPDELTALTDQLDSHLSQLAQQAPTAALKAVAARERLTRRTGHEAAHAVEADELSPETIGKALGVTADTARSRITHYLLSSH